MSVTVRVAVEADLEAMLALEASVPEAPHWTEAHYRAMLAEERYVFLVAEDGDALVGFSATSLIVGEGELESIVVAASARRKGIGQALLEATCVRLAERDGSVLRLEVRASNVTAQAFYRSLGFAQDGARKNYYTNPAEDAVLMQRSISK